MSDFISKYGTQLIAGFIAIIGILLGLFWTQFFAWRKYKREQKAALNHVLFHLLELFHFVSRNDFQKYIEVYIKKMEERFGPIPDSDRKGVEDIIVGIIKEKISALSDEDEIKELENHYEASVKQVAYINPFMAYSLAGQSTRLKRLGMLGDYFDSLKDKFESEEELVFLKQVLSNYTEEKFLHEIIEDIKESVLEVSKKISYFKYIKARKFFVKTDKSLSDDLDEEINMIVDQIEEQIKKNS
jgi:hypothetical protein